MIRIVSKSVSDYAAKHRCCNNWIHKKKASRVVKTSEAFVSAFFGNIWVGEGFFLCINLMLMTEHSQGNGGMLPHTPNNNLLMFLGNLLIIPPTFWFFSLGGARWKSAVALPGKRKIRALRTLHPLARKTAWYKDFFDRKIKRYGSLLYHRLPSFVQVPTNIDTTVHTPRFEIVKSCKGVCTF